MALRSIFSSMSTPAPRGLAVLTLGALGALGALVGCGGGTSDVSSSVATEAGVDAPIEAAPAPSCTDGVKNGDETDVDCGGSCGKCADEKACAAASDCASGVCTASVCQAAACDDHVKNGTETDVDCGGSCGKCADEKACAAAGDCASGVCTGNVCQAAACDDHVKNGAETDVDCGGATCDAAGARCALGKACAASTDCAQGACTAGVCARTITAVATWGNHTCAVRAGVLECWGSNGNGELGYGDTTVRGNTPGSMGSNLPAVSLGTGRSAVAVSVADSYSCAILDDGSVKCWGVNGYGQLGQGDTLTRGNAPGEMGDALAPIALGTGRTAKQIATGIYHACAILDDDTLKCWGRNQAGQLGLGDTTNRGDKPGEMGDALPVVNVGTGRHAVAIAASNDFTCALLDDATMKCWGLNNNGQLGLGDTLPRGTTPATIGDGLPAIALGTGRTAIQIALAANHTCALLDDGTVKCWGYNLDGRLGVGDLVDRGNAPGTMGDALPAIQLGTGRKAIALTTQSNSACAILDDTTVKCWGWNNHGDLGVGDTTLRGASPSQMGDALPIAPLGTGRSVWRWRGGGGQTCAILDDDTLKCWGANNYGQLGQGDTRDRGAAPNQMGDALPPISF